MQKFLFRLFLFLSPLLFYFSILFTTYFLADPFQDFGPYTNYSWKYTFQNLGDLGTKKLLHSSQKYNSFILGSSRSTAIYACYLNQRIKKSHFFHFASWTESIGGMEKRLRFIDSLGLPIKNVILCLDPDKTFLNDGKISHLDHYLLTGEKEILYLSDQHFKNFADNINIDKLKLLSGQIPSEATWVNWISDSITNDHDHRCTDIILKKYQEKSKTAPHIIESWKKKGIFIQRRNSAIYAGDQISVKEEESIKIIDRLLKRHQTNLLVVINPAYNQMKFSKNDSIIIRKYFGNNIHDFSGINSFTNEQENYSDANHFRHWIGCKIIDSIIPTETSEENHKTQ